MKKILFAASAFVFVAVGSAALIPTNAEAIPVFARKYGMACASCHTMFPKLTKMGVAFRERGFRFSAGRDDIDSQDDRGKNFDAGENAVFAAAFPFTVRSQILYTSAGPTVDALGTPVMPGHRPGMLDGAARGSNKVGFGEFGLISSGSYDNFSWWLDASLAGGIAMLEGIYYADDLLKIRFGRVQNNVGYGMTMMSKRPLAYGWNDAAQMAGGTMLMMADGISIHGTTNGDSGVGTYYDLTFGTYGKDAKSKLASTSIYGRVAQEIMDNHIVGVYAYSAKNYTSNIFGGDAAMLMGMNANATVAAAKNVNVGDPIATAMSFKDVTRYGVDFVLNYGEPFQVWGAYTAGSQTSYANQKLDVMAVTLSAEWKFTDADLIGVKYDASRTDLQMMSAAVLRPKTTSNTTLFGIHQLAENVQAIASVTRTSNQVDSMGMAMMKTTAVQRSFTTGLLAIDIAL
ncbi:MAG: hypothetical protein JKY80_04470 [Mariprofundaceae bacterium]|nr:hypothetical protein [Mariprofundaceae bacterium]